MEGDFSNSTRRGQDRGFDFTFHMARLCTDLAARLPELSHVEQE